MTRVCSVRGLGILVALLLGVASAAMAQASPAMPNPATSQFEAQLAQFTGGQVHAVPSAPVAPVAPKHAAPEPAHRFTSHPVAPGSPATDVGGVLQIPGVNGGSVPWSVIVMLTALTLIPSILVCMTPFARLLIVFHFLRQALGLQTTPSNQTLIGLSLILTFFLMQPVANQVYQDAFVPMQSGQLSAIDALAKAEDPMRHFMAHYVREKDVAMFVELAKEPRPASMDDVSMRVLLPAYILSELKAGFQIGTVLFLPFLIVDMVVASITTSVGMLQLPPVVISTPLKLLLFLMVDGWHLLISSLMRSFQ
jgi:flagellar biosynthetic protein FliP